jgi:purine-binding chemotaxis protein CheW
MKIAAEKIVTFRLGDELFAAEVQSVERVLRYTAPRTVPNMPDWVDGVIEYQQKVVPVVDLRRRFNLPPLEDMAGARTLVVSSAGEWVGLVVDAVDEVGAFDVKELQPPPAFFKGLAGEYLRGLLRRKDRLVILLDVDRLLSATERLALETATGAAGAGAARDA